MAISHESWLDAVELDPVTDRHITEGARWHGVSRETFTDSCIDHFVYEDQYTDPAFIAKAVRWYVERTKADVPGAAEIFDLT